MTYIYAMMQYVKDIEFRRLIWEMMYSNMTISGGRSVYDLSYAADRDDLWASSLSIKI